MLELGGSMLFLRYRLLIVLAVSAITLTAQAQRPRLSAVARTFVKVDAPVVALTNARVIDGAGTPARAQQTILIRDGKIAALGATANVTIPEGATVIDL